MPGSSSSRCGSRDQRRAGAVRAPPTATRCCPAAARAENSAASRGSRPADVARQSLLGKRRTVRAAPGRRPAASTAATRRRAAANSGASRPRRTRRSHRRHRRRSTPGLRRQRGEAARARVVEPGPPGEPVPGLGRRAPPAGPRCAAARPRSARPGRARSPGPARRRASRRRPHVRHAGPSRRTVTVAATGLSRVPAKISDSAWSVRSTICSVLRSCSRLRQRVPERRAAAGRTSPRRGQLRVVGGVVGDAVARPAPRTSSVGQHAVVVEDRREVPQERRRTRR